MSACRFASFVTSVRSGPNGRSYYEQRNAVVNPGQSIYTQNVGMIAVKYPKIRTTGTGELFYQISPYHFAFITVAHNFVRFENDLDTGEVEKLYPQQVAFCLNINGTNGSGDHFITDKFSVYDKYDGPNSGTDFAIGVITVSQKDEFYAKSKEFVPLGIV